MQLTNEQQRTIGKLQMAVNILLKHDNNDEIFFAKKSHLLKWTELEEEVIEGIMNACTRLESVNVCVNAARKYKEEHQLLDNEYAFWLATFLNIGGTYLQMLQKEDLDISYLLKINQYNYENYSIVDYAPSSLEAGLEYLINFLSNEILMVNKYYDWDIIQTILNKNDRFKMDKEFWMKLRNLKNESGLYT